MQFTSGLVALLAHGAHGDGGGATSFLLSTVTTTVTETVYGRIDGSFGPQYGSMFDFTLLFDHTIFTIVPTVLLITACPLYVYFRRQSPVEVERDALFWTKQAIASILFIIQLVQLILWTTAIKLVATHHWAIAASAVSCFAALCIALMLSTGHRRSIQPSTLLSIYFFITVFLDGIRARSYLLREGLDAVGATQVVITVVKFTLLILEEVPKTSSLKNTYLRNFLGKEALSGFWSRALFLWLNEVFIIGFRSILTVDDLGNLGPEFRTERLVDRFNVIWAVADNATDRSLLYALLRQHGGSLLLAVPGRIGYAVASFAQPFIVYRAVDIVNRKSVPDAEKHGMVLATILVYMGIAMFRAMYTHLNNRTSVLVRGSLLGKIYGKTLVLPAKKASDGAALTHITADLDSISNGIVQFHDLWICFFEIGFAMFFLYRYVEYSCFLLLIPAGVSTLTAWYFGPKRGDAQKVWNKTIEERVSQTTSLLSQARSIKTIGLTATVTQYIINQRTKEIRCSRRYRWMESLVLCLSFLAEAFTPVIVIAGAIFLTKIPMPLQASRIFATVALLNLSAVPIETILRSYSAIRDTIGCVDRMGNYIIEKERVDERTIVLRSPPSGDEKVEETASDDGAAIETTNVSLAPVGKPEPVISGATISVPRGKLTIATGATGRGKTTFLKSIIGEADIMDGQVCVEDIPMAYCDQKPWLCNDTIKANIVGPNVVEVDEAWYQSVLGFCCLNEDLSELALGDQTLAGTKGAKLSGGQGQRVALARALHSRAPVMILDDVFSALDRPTARKIFFNLFSRNGILRRLQTTVILATHSVEFLDAADAILRFDAEGVVCEPGLGILQDDDPDGAVPTVHSQSGDATDVTVKDASVCKDEAIPDEPEDADDIARRDVHHKGDWKLWLFFFKSAPLWMFVIFISTSIIQAIAERLTTIFMRIWIANYANSKSFFIGYAVCGLAPTIGYLGMAIIFWHFIVPYYAKSMHKQLVEAMLGANIEFLTSTDHATLINRISQDMTLITQRFALVFFQIPYLIALVFTDIGLIVAASYYTIILIPFLCLVFYGIQLVYLRTSRQLRMLDLEAKTPLYKQMTEIGAGVEHIRAFRWEKEFLEQSYALIDESQKPFYYMSAIQRWLGLVLDFVNLVLALVLLCFALYWDNTTSESGIGLGFIGLLSLGTNFNHFMELYALMETSLAAVARLRTFVQDTPQERDDPNLIEPKANWPSHGKIEFENVSAGYNAGDGRKDVLRNVSFTIDAKKRAGFIGRTGSGKSSIFLALLGFLPYRGSIRIDGEEVSRIPRHILRTRLTAIPQDALILPGTVRQNLMPWLLNEKNPTTANQASPLALREVLLSTFMVDKIRLAGGLDVDMGRLGLSSGERQLFSMARSMLLNLWYEAKVVLMDEATSNLDLDTDRDVQWAVGEAFHGLTRCTIAHRTEIVADYDMVFEVVNGTLST